MTEPPIADTPPEQDLLVAGPLATRLRTPRAIALLRWLRKTGTSRYRFRFLQGLALSLAINQCSLLWLGRLGGVQTAGQAHLLASTANWCVGISLVAGWFLLGGWFDTSTRALFEQLAGRRGYDDSDCQRLEAMASWRWLALLLAFPGLLVAAVGTTRITTLAQLSALLLNLVLYLAGTQLVAACTIFAVGSLRRLEVKDARRLWVVACLAPEAIRPILPGFPTIRTIASALGQLILRWGASG